MPSAANINKIILLSIFSVMSVMSIDAHAGARDRIIDPETSYIEQRTQYMEKYQDNTRQYETEQSAYLTKYDENNTGYERKQKTFLTDYNDRDDQYMADGQTYLTAYQAYQNHMEERQKEVLEAHERRHREYLEIDLPGPPLYFPHDD